MQEGVTLTGNYPIAQQCVCTPLWLASGNAPGPPPTCFWWGYNCMPERAYTITQHEVITMTQEPTSKMQEANKELIGTSRATGNYYGKYNMQCKYIRPQPYLNGMMCTAFTYGTCMCQTCSHKDDRSL